MIKKINNNDREFATSNCLAVYEFFQDGAPIFCHENLYRTTSGSYFLKVETGPDSFYYPTNLGLWDHVEAVFSLSEAEAKAWAERKLPVMDYCEIFGTPEEG